MHTYTYIYRKSQLIAIFYILMRPWDH